MTKNTTFEIGKNIKKLREFRGYSQQYMADQLDVTQKTYSNIESDDGKVNKGQIEHIAKILEVDPAYLLTYDDRNVFNYKDCTQSDMFNTYNSVPKHERALYDQRINELKEEVDYLRKLVDKLSK